jgi:hypothetical protein
MISTSARSYDSTYNKAIKRSIETTEEIIQTIQDGNADTIIALSEKYINNSGIYQRILAYFSTFLTNDIFVTPKKVGVKSIKANKYLENYKQAVYFADTTVNPKLNFPRMTFKMLVYGAYYGLFIPNGDYEASFKDLPYNYCRTRFKTLQNIDVVEFDVSYFDTITDKKLQKMAFDEYPKEFSKAHAAYKKDSNLRWFAVPAEMGLAFYFHNPDRPFFISTIPAISSLNDYKKLEKNLDKQDLERIIVQKIPVDKEGNFMLDTTEAMEMHRGVVAMLANSPNIDIITTFADLTLLGTGDKTKADRDNLEKIERSVFNEAGVSRLLFSSDSASALDASINNDASFVMSLSEQYSNWLTYQLNLRYSESGKFFFEAAILPLSLYNKKDMLDLYLKSAQFGYSKIIVAIASGLKQSAFLDIIELENEILGLQEKMVPLQSSNTTAGTDVAAESGGRPEKDLKNKSDKTIDNKESL